MKKAFIYLLAASFTVVSAASAQETKEAVKQTTKKTGKAIKNGANKVGNKTVEVGSKGVAKVQDRTFDGKVAPNGKTVYINEDSRYYWINNKGKRIYVTENQLRDKQ